MKYFNFVNVSVLCKTNRPSFCLILKLSHALDGLLSVYYLGGIVVIKCAFCWMKHHWKWLLHLENFCFMQFPNLTTFTYCCFKGILSRWNPLFILDIARCCDGKVPGLGEYLFPLIQNCTALVLYADCTEDSFICNF